jgi:hypothetical protein
MGFLHRFLTGDVLEPAELARAEAEGIVLHERKLVATVWLDEFRAPGRRSDGRKLMSSGGVLVTRSWFVMWAMGERQLHLVRAQLPITGLEVSTDTKSVRFAFRAEQFHADRSGSVNVRLRTPHATRIAELATAP